MVNLASDLGVQSYCFRGFKDNAKVADLVREIGLNKIELCAVHADFSDESTFDGVIETYRSAGVEIVSIGVQGANGERDKEEKYFEFAKRAGAKYMSVYFGAMTFPECYRVSEELSAQYDVKVAIHNHGGYHWLGSSEMLTRVFHDTNDRVGLCLDTAWALDAKQKPIQMAEKFGERLFGAHIKDFVFDRARNPEDVVVGTGNLDLPAFVKIVQSNPNIGYCVLEYEGDVENPTPALKECVEAVRNAS